MYRFLSYCVHRSSPLLVVVSLPCLSPDRPLPPLRGKETLVLAASALEPSPEASGVKGHLKPSSVSPPVPHSETVFSSSSLMPQSKTHLPNWQLEILELALGSRDACADKGFLYREQRGDVR